MIKFHPFRIWIALLDPSVLSRGQPYSPFGSSGFGTDVEHPDSIDQFPT